MGIYLSLLETARDFLRYFEEQEEQIQVLKIFSLKNDLKKHVMFRLFYLTGYCFLRKALEPRTNMVTRATQCNTDLYGTDLS